MFTISDRLLSIIFLSPLKMASFSATHRLHLLPPHLYDGAVETMDHFIDSSTPNKNYSICPSLESMVSWKSLEKDLQESRISCWRILDHSFCIFAFSVSTLLLCVAETLFSG